MWLQELLGWTMNLDEDSGYRCGESWTLSERAGSHMAGTRRRYVLDPFHSRVLGSNDPAL